MGLTRMPISDTYVVQYLLQETCRHGEPLVLQETETDSYAARLREVNVELTTVRDRSGPRVFLTLSSCLEHIDVSEPVNKGLLREKYDSTDDEQLAHLLRSLADAITDQCAARDHKSEQMVEAVRESIYRRLIGAEGSGQ